MNDYWLFVVMPAAAVALALCGGLVRYVLWRRQTAASRVRAAESGTGVVRAIWRIAIAMVLIGHFLAFAFPDTLLRWNSRHGRLVLLEATGLFVGGIALAAWLVVVAQRAGGRRGARSSIDVVAGTLIAVEVISGVAIAMLYRWASSWSGVTLVPYLHSLLAMKPEVELVAAMPFLVRLHVVGAFALLAIAPYTDMVRPAFVLLDRVAGWIFAPVAALWRPTWLTRRG